jgi:predicted ribosomally synthesized peptide with SipW-like signal peptide
LVAGAAAAIAAGATGAFFSDTETSTGNTFAAGAIDLKVDNESYYNGNVCIDLPDDNPDAGHIWQGNAPYPVPGTPCDTSFPLADLDDGFLFFNFTDLKPDDEGEDTISLHVQNEAWACMDVTLNLNDDVSTTEPEGEVDEEEDPADAWDGELAQTLEFFWWADDGDNVYEEGEEWLSDGVQSLLDLATTSPFSVALADANNNVWDPENPGVPLPANDIVYIAKAWCMGNLTLDPVPNGDGVNPSVDPGVDCDGTFLGNETQTDKVELNVMFTAVQARHNEEFLCNPEDELASLAVNKVITADTVGIGVEDFELHIDGPIPGPGDDIIVSDNVAVPSLPPGAYTVYEVILGAGLPPGAAFTSTIGGACDVAGNVTLNPGDNLVCTINNVEN